MTATKIGNSYIEFFHSIKAMTENETYDEHLATEYLTLLKHNIDISPTTLDVHLLSLSFF